MAKYRCSVCGWIYDENKGLPPKYEEGTPFSKLDDDFKCPQCNANKGYFKYYSE